MSSNRFIISLGGSLIVPDEIEVNFLREFKELIEREASKGKQFILITGGGRTSRRYTSAAKELGDLTPEDLDWLGIHTTRLNGHLLRTIFREIAHKEIITNPETKLIAEEPVVIAAGYRPGYSTDNLAVMFARQFSADVVLNLSNIDYVYDKDPKQNPDAKPIKTISWHEFRKIVGNKWDPGAHLPFDPVASKNAEEFGLRVVIMNGKNITNLRNFLEGQSFQGTVIE